MGVAGSWRLWLQCCAQAAAALGETTQRRGQHIPRVKVQGGWMWTRRADPPAGLPVLPGRWGTVFRPGHRGGGAGEAGEGTDGSTHAGHHPRAAPQPFASETYRWESTQQQFPDYFQEFAEFAGRRENETDEWLKLIVNFLCLPRALLMGASLSKSSHLITLLLPLYSCSHTSTDKHSHILGSLARSCANKGVWENLSS